MVAGLFVELPFGGAAALRRHNARNPAEFAAYQWDQIMMYMRSLENLPPEDEAVILEYMKTAR